jgi:hypothetical protein
MMETDSRSSYMTDGEYLAREALDIVARLINELGHTGYEWHSWQQVYTQYEKLIAHPAFKQAEQRRRDQFWKRCEQAAKTVASWPEWMKGSRENRR